MRTLIYATARIDGERKEYPPRLPLVITCRCGATIYEPVSRWELCQGCRQRGKEDGGL